MLRKILCISGKPGLYEMLKYSKNMVIVENLIDHKRGPVFASEKIISLGDIAIYTTGEDVQLANVLESMKQKYDCRPIASEQFKTNEQLSEIMSAVLPDYDPSRVHFSDIRKLINWYNVLVNAGRTDFLEKKTDDKATDSEADSK